MSASLGELAAQSLRPTFRHLQLGALAHNLLRWTATIGLGATGQVVAKTLRRRLLALPGRLPRSARRRLPHLPCDWPWANHLVSCA